MRIANCPHCAFTATQSGEVSKDNPSAYWRLVEHVNADHAAETFLCGRRGEGVPGVMGAMRDFWRKEANGDRTCSYCGSLHEEDLFAILEKYVAGEEGYDFGTTYKRYKVYARRPGVMNAAQGGIKFYTHHVDREHADFEKRCELFDKAVALERERLRKRFGARAG